MRLLRLKSGGSLLRRGREIAQQGNWASASQRQWFNATHPMHGLTTDVGQRIDPKMLTY